MSDFAGGNWGSTHRMSVGSERRTSTSLALLQAAAFNLAQSCRPQSWGTSPRDCRLPVSPHLPTPRPGTQHAGRV
eukprot:1147168-Pelagomonas_calceolata.AAC.5